MTYSQNNYLLLLLKLSSLCRDKNENVNHRQKSPERTTSISVTLKLLQCVRCSTGKMISKKILIEMKNSNIHNKIFIQIHNVKCQ